MDDGWELGPPQVRRSGTGGGWILEQYEWRPTRHLGRIGVRRYYRWFRAHDAAIAALERMTAKQAGWR